MRTLRWIAREARGSGGRLAFFTACLAIGVAAVVSVAGVSDALEGAIRSASRELLAADVVARSTRPIAGLDEALDVPGVRTARTRELATVVRAERDAALGAPDGAAVRGEAESALVELKAVGDGYPFYGALEVDPPLADTRLSDRLGDDGVLVGDDLLERLGLAHGDRLRVGGEPYEIRGTIVDEPDRLDFGFAAGPRLMMSLEGLERSGLERFGSRIAYRLLVRAPPDADADAVGRLAGRLRGAVEDAAFVRVESYDQARPELRRGVSRVDRFLGLVALLSLLVGGVGVAQSVRAWLATRYDAIAVLRSIGFRPREVFALYVAQTALLALVGSAVGALAGTGVARLVPELFGDVLPVEVAPGFEWAAIARGLALGVVVALLFCAGPLTAILRVPPVRVLRRDAEPIPPPRATVVAGPIVILAGIAAIATLQSGSVERGVGFAGGLAVAVVLLAAMAWGLVRVSRKFPRHGMGAAVRYGLAAAGRPGSGTLGAIVALGAGVLVVVGLHLVQSRLVDRLSQDVPADAPSAFLVDIQPDQWDGVRGLLEGAGSEGIESVPVVVARIRAIDGVPVESMVDADDGRRERWALTREQRLALFDTLPRGNAIVEGELWSMPDRDEVSVEADYAADIGAGVGSVLALDVQGVPVELTVSSLREVEWESFSINFFVIVEPGALGDAPAMRVATARIPEGREGALRDAVADEFPNVTFFEVRPLLQRIAGVLDRAALGVGALGAFSVFAGIAILAGAIAATASRRGREVALLKTLGMTRSGIALALSVEYAALGAIAGTVGAVGGAVLAWVVVTQGFRFEGGVAVGKVVVAIAATVALSVVVGIASSAGALTRRPGGVLKQAD